MQLAGYDIKQTLGKGGMAKVYLGHQRSLDRPVAIKVLNKKLLDNPTVQSQFQQESLMVAHLNHPNIIQVIDQGEAEDGRPFFVMQYVKGIPLLSVVSRDDVNLTRKIDIAVQICSALSYAHRNGVVHRDIKPANVLVDYDGHVRVVDFGIAGYFRHMSRDDADQPEPAKMIFGTPAYMAPEQSDPKGEVTHLSDLYALGILMFELFLGCKPKDFESKPATFPSALLDVMRQCINEDKSLRPQSADEIKRQLLLILKGRHIKASRWEKEKNEGAIPDQYGLLDVLKENTFGATYLVSEPKRNTLLVVKKQYIAYSGDAKAVSDVMARQKHPHIATIHGTAKNDKVFIAVVEYVEGGSLHDRLTQAFPLERWLLLALQVCKALEFAHDKKVIHGNLRPSNILVVNPSQVKVTDFGFKNHNAGGKDDWYQPTGEELSALTDIYSAGAVLFHLLTGQVVEQGSKGLVNKDALAVLPKPLQEVLIKMLAVNPVERYQSIKPVRLDLEAFNQGEETVVFQPPKSEVRISHKRQLAGKVILLGILVVLVAELFWFFNGGL